MENSNNNALSAPLRPRRSRKQFIVFFVTMYSTVVLLVGGTIFLKDGPSLILDLILVATPVLSGVGFFKLRDGKSRSAPRLKLYRLDNLVAWVPCLLVFAVYANRNIALVNVGFTFQSAPLFASWCLVLAVGLTIIFFLSQWLQKNGWLGPVPRDAVPFPETRVERLICLFLAAPTAGFCEEVVYRSYVLTEVPHRLHGCPMVITLLGSCALFALAHMEMGGSAVLVTFIVGALLAWPVVQSGTIYPSMVTHTIYDAVVLVWVGPILVRGAKAQSPPPGTRE